ncbi:riboflavin synthase [Paracoccaceae bacterium GXU_MW_L88]
MFTGLIEQIGTVLETRQNGDMKARIACDYDLETVALGASIACDGCCLTVTEKGETDGRGWFAVDISAETLSKTTLGDWREGRKINLERSLKLGDELGGHIVSGHVDGVAEIVEITEDGESTRITFDAPESLAKYIAAKGSAALNGTSLTVNGVNGTRFDVNLIPHTKEVTTWGTAKTGDRVNLEIDMLARYVARLREFGQ